TTPAATSATEETETTTTTEPIEDEVFYGDVNGDGGVSIVDVIMLNKAVLGSETLSSGQKRNADCNLDGLADANDSLIILKHLVDLILELPLK
ncbi:MAG: dockerin type I repeat-containing protein, partial [Oscillospiraceae bacterium]|nr:dockerin type I repeat-containing protein [Oscillospiraceae bacterium]